MEECLALREMESVHSAPFTWSSKSKLDPAVRDGGPRHDSTQAERFQEMDRAVVLGDAIKQDRTAIAVFRAERQDLLVGGRVIPAAGVIHIRELDQHEM